ncbi:MAG TPA: hypothetical protein VFQ68_04570 [Streptosporangiaceae bacterium]|nr:hypothetical protein [Streptosporangiaceae bacterium]
MRSTAYDPAADRQVAVVRVTHEDRLARFGAGWLRRRLTAHGAAVEVLHSKAQGGREELVEDFICLVTNCAGRLYGMRSAAARRRLLAGSDRCPPAAAGDPRPGPRLGRGGPYRAGRRQGE